MKTTKTRNANYYIAICKKLAIASTATTDEFYKIIDEVDVELGFKRAAFPRIVAKLEEILGKDLEKIVDESTKRRGRDGKNYLFSLSKVNVRSEVEKHFEQIEQNKRAPKREKTTKISPTPRKGALDLIYKVLTNYMENSQYQIDGITFSQVSKITGRGFGSNILEGWKNETNKRGVNLSVQVISKGTEKKIFFKNIKNTIISFTKMYEKLTGIKLDIKLSPMANVKTIAKQDINIDRSDAEIASIYFACAGIMNLSGHNIDIHDLCKTLITAFNIHIVKQDLLAVLKREAEFSILQYGNAVGLKDKDTSWEIISEMYHPNKFKFSVMARIGLGLEQINEYVPAKLVSVISDTDGIYELELNKSVHSLKSMTRLFRTFRGTDMILDKTIEEDIIREIKIQDGRMYRDNLAYEIEK